MCADNSFLHLAFETRQGNPKQKKKSIAGAHDFFVVVLLGAGASELFSEGPCVCMWLLAEHAVSARLANTDALVSHLALL